MFSIIWTIIIGFIAGVIAKWIHSGPNEPSGFVTTAILGIVGVPSGAMLELIAARSPAG